jgi:ActR/RegA family two-component response regulator
MSPRLANVRPIRPLRTLLVTDDERYASKLVSAAAVRGFEIELASGDDDLDTTTNRHPPNVVVLDARNTFASTSRAATVFAALHPKIAIVLVSDRAAERSVGNVHVVDRRRSAKRLLRELELAYLELAVPAEGGD